MPFFVKEIGKKILNKNRIKCYFGHSQPHYNKKIDKKLKMTLTEKNVVEKWNQWFPESVRGEASDNDSN